MVNRVLDKDRYVFLEKPTMEVLHKKNNELRTLQIEAYLMELKEFRIPIGKLAENQYDTKRRNLMLNLALILLSEKKLWEKTLEDKKIPLKPFSRIVEEPIFELEDMQNQILAYALLFRDDLYPLIRKYLHYGAQAKDESPLKDADNTGIPLKRRGKTTFILTSQGQFMKIRVQEASSGYVASGKNVRKKPNLIKPLILLLLLSLLLGSVYISLSKRISQTIIVKAVGEVKMNFNTWGDMVNVIGINTSGKVFVEGAEFVDKDVDTVLAEIIEQAYITETIKEQAEITILVSGEFLPEDFFKSGKTHDRILSYQLNAKINNNGSFLFVE